MNEAKMKEVATQAAQATVDVVKAQMAKGASDQGVSKARHVAIVADVMTEMLESHPAPDGEDATRWMRLVLRAALSGDLLNASQLRQRLEKDGVLKKERTISSEYGVDE